MLGVTTPRLAKAQVAFTPASASLEIWEGKDAEDFLLILCSGEFFMYGYFVVTGLNDIFFLRRSRFLCPTGVKTNRKGPYTIRICQIRQQNLQKLYFNGIFPNSSFSNAREFRGFWKWNGFPVNFQTFPIKTYLNFSKSDNIKMF